MKLSSVDREVQSFFLSQGLTHGLFLWISFRAFLLNPNWREQFTVHGSSEDGQPIDWLAQWQSSHAITYRQPLAYWLFSLLGAAIGSISMAGALSYSGQWPVNIWMLLLLFAFLPLLLTGMAAFTQIPGRSHHHTSTPPLVRRLIEQSGLEDASTHFSNLIFPWAVWKLQSFSLMIIAFAILTFLVMATFQDYAFGWSSTLIENDQVVVGLMQGLTLPWRWMIPAPSEELILASRFLRSEPLGQAALLGQWWPTITVAIFFYGLLPRLVLWWWVRLKFAATLKKDIVESGDVERFINGCRRVSSIDAVTTPPEHSERPTFESVAMDDSNVVFVAWQGVHSAAIIARNLGTDAWANDEAWLTSKHSCFQKPVILLVTMQQTPTGELADSLALLKQQNPSVAIGLIQEHQGFDRDVGAFKSWRYFSTLHDTALVTVQGERHE